MYIYIYTAYVYIYVSMYMHTYIMYTHTDRWIYVICGWIPQAPYFVWILSCNHHFIGRYPQQCGSIASTGEVEKT